MAWRVGASLRDLEFVQFHPTALNKAGAPRFLISEAVRGEGAYLLDAEGRRFVFDYHPKGELAPRDVVSRAIFSHLQKTTRDPAIAHVWLDLRPIPVEIIKHRFPNIVQVCQHWGVDVFQAPIPVAPAAHYWMGGITADQTSRTSIPGLYAVGETASTGVHGANRLASNSLLECLVFGAQLAMVELSPDSTEPSVDSMTLSSESAALLENWGSQITYIESLQQALPRLMWQRAGICRDGRSLELGIALVEAWRQEFAALPLSQVLIKLRPCQRLLISVDKELDLRHWGEMRNLLDIAYLILKSAAFRTESRGGHYRLDYPQTDLNWQVHTLVQNQSWQKSTFLDQPDIL